MEMNDKYNEERGVTQNTPEKYKYDGTYTATSQQPLEKRATSPAPHDSSTAQFQSTNVESSMHIEQPISAVNSEQATGSVMQHDQTFEAGQSSIIGQPEQQSIECPTQSSKVDGTGQDELPIYKQKHKFNSAGRKRFRFLMKQGYERSEARQLAMLPMTSQPHRTSGSGQLSKMIRSSGGNRTAEEILQDHYRSFPDRPTTKSVSLKPSEKNSIKIGIMSKFYPDHVLNPDRLRSIEQEILFKVIQQEKSDIKPKFHGIAYKPGFLEVTCADNVTANWLKEVVPNMKPWHTAELAALDEKEILRPETLSGYFPNSLGDNNEKIFGYIGAQNDGVTVKDWKAVNRLMHKNMIHLTFNVDLKSFVSLKSIGFKINYKFGLVQLHPTGAKN